MERFAIFLLQQGQCLGLQHQISKPPTKQKAWPLSLVVNFNQSQIELIKWLRYVEMMCWNFNWYFKFFLDFKDCFKPSSFKVVQQQQRKNTTGGTLLTFCCQLSFNCSNEQKFKLTGHCPACQLQVKEKNLSLLQAVSSSIGTTGRWYYPPETFGSEMFSLSSSTIVNFMHSCNKTDGNLTCTNGFGGVPSYSHWVGLHTSSAIHFFLNAFEIIMCRHVEMKWRCSLEGLAAQHFIIMQL